MSARVQRFSSLAIYVTKRCSLACRYCFLDKNPVDATWGTLRAVLDWWFRNTGQKTHIQIFGTEPLVRFDLVRTVFEFAEYLARKTGRMLTKGITTNGVNLTRLRIDWLTRHRVNLLCSIDGTKEQHDKWRVRPNGRGSYDEVSKNFKRWVRKNPRAEAAMTVTPDSIPNIVENVKAVIGLGFRNMALNKCLEGTPPYCNGDFVLLRELLKEVNDVIVEHAKKDKRIQIAHISNHLIKRMRGTALKNVSTTCGACKGSVATDIDGKIYICHRAVFDHEKFGIGDVWNGVDWKAVTRWRSLKHTYCNTCGMVECSPCYVINLSRMGDIMRLTPEYCRYNHLIFRASNDLEQKLRKIGKLNQYCGLPLKPRPVIQVRQKVNK